jgi:hypothetical protein
MQSVKKSISEVKYYEDGLQGCILLASFCHRTIRESESGCEMAGMSPKSQKVGCEGADLGNLLGRTLVNPLRARYN